MMTRKPAPEIDDAPIVLIGCVLGYQATRPTPAVFLIQPHAGSGCAVVHEEALASTGAELVPYTDLHGNPALKTVLAPGYNEIRYEATVTVPSVPVGHPPPFSPFAALMHDVPLDVMRYASPSRYCESDKLTGFALQEFGHLPRGFEQAQAVCDWAHRHLEYRYGSGDATLSACDVLKRGHGVCRDFAHVLIALCRALDLPARYVAGHVPQMRENQVEEQNDIGIDFHAYAEVYFDGGWHTFDARHNRPLQGRIKLAHGMDAVDAAFATFYGDVVALKFEVWSREVERQVPAR